MTFGLTPQGFNKKRLADEKASEENALIAEFGDINVQPQSVFGQFVGVMSKAFADVWENMEDLHLSQYPSSAEGVSLDYVVALNGIQRLQAEKTFVYGLAEGNEGTLIPTGSLARQPTANQTFSSTEDVIISASNSSLNNVSVDTLEADEYQVSINAETFTFSLPKIEFDSLFVTGNEITVSINGEPLTAVPFNTDSETTIEDIATAIAGHSNVNTAISRLGLVITFDDDFVTDNEIVATINGDTLNTVNFDTDQATTIGDLATVFQSHASVTSATVTDTREITIVPVDEGTFLIDSIVTTQGATQPEPIKQRIDVEPLLGFEANIDFVTVTSGASQPTADISFLTPNDIETVAEGLVAIINESSDDAFATNLNDGNFQIKADDTDIPYALSVSSNLSIALTASPVPFLAQNFGVIPAPIDSLTEIVTPIAGWDSITNPKAGVTGRERETDAELRIRRQNSIRIAGAATVEAIRARILNDVSGVTQALVFENKDMKQENTTVIFVDDFVTGNAITFTINGVPQSTINFTSDHLTTMQLIEVQLESLPNIDNVTISGANDRVLTIEFTSGFDTTINDIQISGGASQTIYNIQPGRFPKSFEAVVQGGNSQDIADMIWLTKPAGIQTFGNTSEIVEDSMGFDHSINFSRPTELYIWVDVDLTLYDEEDFPSNGVELVRQAIADYGDTLNIGQDVLLQRVLCQIFEVSGIASGSMQIAFTLNEGDTPSFGSSDISIADNEIAVFSTNRITAQVV